MARRFVIILTAMLLGTLAFGQDFQYGKKKDKTPTERSVTGTVTDAEGNPIPGAIVQLKNMKTLQVRSFITKEKGEFYFQGLSMDVDWEFKAEYNGKSSDTRTVTTFDTHPSITMTLKIKS